MSVKIVWSLWITLAIMVLDVITKAVIDVPPETDHYRTDSWEIFVLVVIVATFFVIVRYPTFRLPATLIFAGGLSNLISTIWVGYIPNPFFIDRGGVWVAFNVADVVCVLGALMLSVSIYQKLRSRATNTKCDSYGIEP